METITKKNLSARNNLESSMEDEEPSHSGYNYITAPVSMAPVTWWKRGREDFEEP